MSASFGDSANNQEVDLNLAPIIDCFTVLITYLLVTASFLTLNAVDVGVSALGTGEPPPPDAGPPPMIMTLEMKADGGIAIALRGGTEKKEITYEVKGVSGSWNHTELLSYLQRIIGKWPQITEVSISAEPTIVYKDIVNMIHQIQNVMPKVYISG